MTNEFLEKLRRAGARPWLRGLGPLHRTLKSGFNACAGLVSRGATVRLVNGRSAVVPWELVGVARWDAYEPVTANLYASLIERQPDTIAVDVGCAAGVFSLIALSARTCSRVYSMDADLMSLAMTRRLGEPMADGRHSLVWGFCANRDMAGANPQREDLGAAVQQTDAVLAKAGLRPRPGANRYTCIDGNQPAEIPCWDLDGLFGPLAEEGRPMVLKVDIEGAEKLAVEGAGRLLGRPNVQFLVGVHPGRLPGFGTTREKLWEAFSAKGNQIELIEKDTEEHWWVKTTS